MIPHTLTNVFQSFILPLFMNTLSISSSNNRYILHFSNNHFQRINSEASITDRTEDSIMASYPMWKVSLIHDEKDVQNNTRASKITENSNKCQNILKKIDEDGGNLKSWFIRDDAVFKPGQKSHLEARRIALYIRLNQLAFYQNINFFNSFYAGFIYHIAT